MKKKNWNWSVHCGPLFAQRWPYKNLQLVSLRLLFSSKNFCIHTKTICTSKLYYTIYILWLTAWICYVNISPFGVVVERSKNKYDQRLEPWTNKFRWAKEKFYAQKCHDDFFPAPPFSMNFLFLKAFCPVWFCCEHFAHGTTFWLFQTNVIVHIFNTANENDRFFLEREKNYHDRILNLLFIYTNN